MKATYDLAISFASEQRNIAEYFARRLDASGYSVFYDDYAKADLFGSDLSEKLGDVYGKNARYCLVIVSADYVRKPWTTLERRNAIGRFMKGGNDYLLCVRTDDVELPGLPDVIGYLSFPKLGEAEIYRVLLEKLGNPDHDSAKAGLSDKDVELTSQVIRACYTRAVFTRMDSEIEMSAMVASLGKTLSIVQSLTPKMSSQALQYDTLGIVAAIDEIERVAKRSDVAYSNFLDRQDAQKIDEQKIRIITSILTIRRMANIAIQLPSSLQTDHFYNESQGSEPPRLLM